MIGRVILLFATVLGILLVVLFGWLLLTVLGQPNDTPREVETQ